MLVLGSGSPRRLELLRQIGIEPSDVRPPDIDETPHPGEAPRAYCIRIASAKRDAVVAADHEIVLCADTTVALGRRILGKPDDDKAAREMLALLSGRRHRVITAVAVRRGTECWQRHVVSAVQMKRLSAPELDAYIASGDWLGKAGGYGIQGPAAAFVPWISGSYTGIVGLPLAETAGLLRAAGLGATHARR